MSTESPEKTAEINLLFDFYGELLPEKQQAVFRLHHQEDLSLAEIAADWGITRQGVHSFLRRAEQSLGAFEEKLGLAGRFLRMEQQKKEALAALETLARSRASDEALSAALEQIRQRIEDWE